MWWVGQKIAVFMVTWWGRSEKVQKCADILQAWSLREHLTVTYLGPRGR